MKKILTLLFTFTTIFINAQLALYSNTFSSAGDWVIGHDASACNLDWQIGAGLSCTGSYPIQDIVSTTASDGYALIDSDAYGGATGGTEVEDSWITMANPVDLNGYPNVVVEFETNYRSYNSEKPFIVIGIGDGTGNVVWPDLDPTTDISTISNVFEAFPGFGTGDETTNPELIQVNISSALVGLTTVQLSDIYVRFHWTGTYGYAWFVDDMKIIETPDNDIRNLSSYIYETNGDGVEYGRTPLSQLPSNYTIGGSVFNFGILDQTNVSLVANFVGPSNFSSNSSISLIENDSTVVLESDEILSLQVGVYNGTFTVTSDFLRVGGPNFSDNVLERNFEITNDVYSLDGIGNHPSSLQQLNSLGTASFTDGSDGLVCATMYPFKNNDTINSVTALITTTTSANAEVILYIVDSLSFTSGSLNNAIFISDLYTVTAQDVANGFIEIPVGNISSNGQLFESLPIQPGNYYAALELFSGGNTYDISIIDDETVGQPAWSSAIYIPLDQAYTNGNAFAISMNLGDNTVPNSPPPPPPPPTGQTRYLDPVFNSTVATNNIVYAVNQVVLLGETLPVATGSSTPIGLDTTTTPPTPILFSMPALEMDIFQPSGDTVSERPLIIYLHTGDICSNY